MAERDDQGFLARWSRRKQAARRAEREPEAEHGAAQDPPGPADANPPGHPSQEADRAPALPDPATLDASSDFSVFLGRDVPIETHRQALRRLWRLDPIYNRMDGLDDYCEDYTDKAKVVKGLRTAYKVGRGMLEQIGDAAARPDEASTTDPAEPQPVDEPARVTATSADPVSPDKSEPGAKSAPESERPTMQPPSSEPRRQRRRSPTKS